jgi:CheY-like chemotaxis protein
MLPQDGAAWQNVQEILTAGRRAKDVVQQILAFSRQTDTARTPTRPHILVQEVLRFLRSVLPATIRLETHCEEDVGTILADATQVQQVVMNLCTNAEYAMREIGGVLEVRLEAVEVDPTLAERSLSLRPGPHIRLTVRDTGRGIDPHIKERIFEPFFTTKAIGEGTGMGLAIVHGIVTSHGGTIMVESVPGHGTTCIVYLPRVEEARHCAEIPQESVPQGTESILFVDDEASLVRLAQQMLHHLGYQVETFTSSGSALAAFRVAPHRFDLAIVDQTMPEMTGEGLTRELRRLRPDLPVILCTGFSHLIDAARAQMLGLDAFLIKPITLGDLAVVIRQVLAQRSRHNA